MGPSVFIDDASSLISYSGTQWTLQTGDNTTANGTYTTCRTDLTNSASGIPSLTYTFVGSAINVYGNPSENLLMNYTVDDSSVRPAIINPSNGQSAKTEFRWWGLEGFGAGSHTIKLMPSRGQPIIDYFIVTPTQDTYLSGKTLIYDDVDPALKYSGNWAVRVSMNFTDGIPYFSSLYSTRNKGDAFTLRFVGSTVSVYGLLNQQAGSLVSSYSVDGAPPTKFNPYNGSQLPLPDKWQLNQKFFHQDLIPGIHNLTVTLDDVTGPQVSY
ncbi:hypothetical protein BDQ12DRAFT_729971 [Crucibulum laeve]|uniref:Uncharacterized protein n=1 Tax=Crucibulum laeve TaxID=68775 RepID=A0A5C3LFU2_9AGAR|nr:hypothetical protein BDQ12DRAFT_729971 [Crucibulum laeve]